MPWGQIIAFGLGRLGSHGVQLGPDLRGGGEGGGAELVWLGWRGGGYHWCL